MARVVTIPIGPIFTGGPCRGIIHVIEQGDTLYLLGRRYRVSVSSIMYANPFVNIYNLQVGDELCIPVGTQSRSVEEIESRMPEGRMPENNRMPEGRMPENNRMPENRMPENRMPENRMPESRMPEGRMPEGRMPENRMQEESMQQEEMESGEE